MTKAKKINTYPVYSIQKLLGGECLMKHGKRLTASEKVLLKKEGYKPEEYLRERKNHEEVVFVHRATGKPISIRY